MTTELTKAAQQALEACPFCGGEPQDAHHIEYGRWAVTCRCGASGASANTGPNATDAAKIKAYSDARTAWNTRALTQRPAAPTLKGFTPPTAELLDEMLAITGDFDASAGAPCLKPPGCNGSNCLGCGERPAAQTLSHDETHDWGDRIAKLQRPASLPAPQQATPTRATREAEQRARMQARLATRREGKATADFDLPPPNDAIQQATPEPDRDGDAFRTAARLGLTLRFYGGCAQSGMPGSPSAYEVVSAGGDPAAAMREAVERASAVIHAGGQAQKLATPEPGLLKTFLAEADRAGITHLPATFGADLAAATPEPEFDDCSSSPTGKHSESWFGNGDCDHCKTGAQNAPMAATPEPLTSFDDPRAQIVYDLLCSDEAPPPEQHWEGWVARRIVDALAATPEPVGEPTREMVIAGRRAVQATQGCSSAGVARSVFEAMSNARPAPGVPDGFALVPVEPTPQMTTLVEHDMWDKPFVNGADVWSAVLAAAQAKGGEHGDSR